LDANADAPSRNHTLSDELQLDLPPGKEEPGGEELDLDLNLELESQSASQTGGENIAPADQDELDLSDLADLVNENEGAGPKSEIVDGGDIELEFQIDEDEQPEAAPVSSITTGNMPAATFEEAMEDIAVEEKPGSKALKPKRKGSRKSLAFLLILLVLAGAGYGLYYAVTQMGIEIPYISDYLKPKPADTSGTLNLSTLDINSKFIENNQSGRLFVITGKVHNGYGMPRSTIRLRGKLFTKGKVLVKTEYSHAGILISDQDLANLSIAEIKQRLNQDAAGTVQPGQNIPFMVVFSDLPPADQLDEFAVELVGSAPAR
jgi:pilus assembly protein FimV